MLRARNWAREIKRDVLILWLAARDPRTPWRARLLAGLVAAYVLSPVQLIPNFIPVLGYLDDLLVVMLGGWLTPKMIPAGLMEELRVKAQAIGERPTSWAAAAVVILLWIGLAAVLAAVAWTLIAPRSVS